MSHEVPPYSSTRLTAQVGLILGAMLALQFVSGALFFLYVFNYNLPGWFTAVRVIHFYVGIATIPFLLAKLASTGFRFGGYYLRVPRFKAAGTPALVPRILSPLLTLDLAVLYFSGLYMLFHYYYTVTNIWPGDFRPVQLHLWAALIAAPLLTAHLMWHLAAALRSALSRSAAPAPAVAQHVETARGMVTRRTLLGMLVGGGAGLAYAFQNTGLRSVEFAHLFIGRIPPEERGGPGDFPVETLFGKRHVGDIAAYRLEVVGEVDHPLSLSYAELLALPSSTHRIRLSCVSGWTQNVVWQGPRVRDLLSLASERAGTGSVAFHSLSGYAFTWHRDRLNSDEALLATHANGATLSENHGYPVRLIVPGYPGENMVKQIDRIFVRRSDQAFHPDFNIV